MTENAGIARLWQGFHHLSENDKDLVLAVAETVGRLTQDTQAMPEQSGAFCNGEHCHSDRPETRHTLRPLKVYPALIGGKL